MVSSAVFSKERSMQTPELIELVQDRTGNVTSKVANDVLMAVLATVTERNLGGAQQHLAGELPVEYADVLRRGDANAHEEFDAAELVRMVAERAGIAAQQSQTWTWPTLSALVESVSTGQRDEFLKALPDDFYPYAMWDV